MPPDPNTPDKPVIDPNLKDEAERSRAAIDNFSLSASNLSTTLDILTVGLGGSTAAFEKFAAHTDTFQAFNQQMAGIGQYATVASGAIKAMASEMLGGSKAAQLMGDGLANFFKNVSAGADNALKFEHGLLEIAGATGQMDKVFSDAGPHLMNINTVLQDHAALMNNIAVATSSSLEEVQTQYKAMGEIVPGSVDKQVQATNEAGVKINALEAAMKLAAGTSGDFKQVTEGLSSAWENYGLEGEKALQFTSRMSDLSQQFGINLAYTKSFIEGNAKAFQMYGSAGEDVDETFNRMFQSMRETGLSAKASTDLIGKMTGSLTNLTTAQKAFLSAQSGGPGGLMGAAKIDELLKNGKSDEVLKMVEDNLKKHFGGKIVTQAEAAQSEAAASAFNKQKMMLTSSAFGKLAGNDQEAARILEMMSKGDNKGAAPLVDAQKGLADHVERGADIQKQSNTLLGDQLRELQKLTTIAEINSLDKVQKYLGNTERTDRGVAGQDKLASQAALMDDVQKISSRKGGVISDKITNKQGYLDTAHTVDIKDEQRDSLRNVADHVKTLLPKDFQQKFGDIENKLLSKNDKSVEAGKEEYKQAMAELNAAQKNVGLNANKGQDVAASKSALDAFSRQYEKIIGRGITDEAPAAHAGHAAHQPTQTEAGRVAQSAAHVNRAVATNQQAPAQAAARTSAATRTDASKTSNQQPDKIHLDIKVRGIVCDKCGTTVMQNPNVQQSTGNTGTHY